MKKYLFSNGDSLHLDEENARISQIIIQGKNIVFGCVPLFTIRFRKRNDEIYYIKGNECKYLKEENNTFFYTHPFFDSNIKIILKDNRLSFQLSVKNKTNDLIEQVELMSFGVFDHLEDEDSGQGSIIIPYNEGARISNMRLRENSPFKYQDIDYPSRGIWFVFPNMISSQFMAYCLNDGGVFLGMLDEERTPKHIDFRYDNECIKLQMRTFTNVNYGEDYAMNFPCVLETFRGNYYDAFDIYRTWFKSHLPLNLKTIAERYDEFPKWYHEAPLIITYPVCGTKDADLEMKPGKLYPYTNALPVINDFAKKTNSKIMALLMQWEKSAPWAPPYSWPPYGDINNFNQFRDELHSKGNYLGLYTSGFGWTNKSHRREYSKIDEFNKLKINECVCESSSGKQQSTVVKEIRDGLDLCPACEKTKQIMVEETQKIIDASVDYVQVLDQNHGGSSYFCYSSNHGHIPAPGKWQIKETNDLLSQIKLKNCLLGCESAASEPFISNLAFSDNRLILNQYIGEAIPLYSYIYHEYVHNFMGNGICNLIQNHPYSMPYRLAYSFLCGDFLTLVINQDGKINTSWCIDETVDEKIPLSFINSLLELRRNKNIFPFMHLGKMMKPLSFNAKSLHFNELYGYQFDFPSVLSSAYEYQGNKIQILVNYSLDDQPVKFPQNVDIFVDNEYKKTIRADNFIIKSLSYIVLKR